MLDVLIVGLFVFLPIVTVAVTRSFTWTAVGLIFGFGVAGNAVQTSMTLGLNWNVRGLQVLAVAVLAVVLFVGALRGRTRESLRRQAVVVLMPMVALGVFLIAMRLLAPSEPGPLTAVGYLVNHPYAEDNAKWLYLTAQLADGRDIAFNGYAGGPLLLLMSMMAALIAVLSSILLGGVNQVAVAANTVIGVQFLLIALVPAALAPLAERRISFAGRHTFIPAPLVWIGMLVLFLASATITSFGHLSLQFVLIVLVLWSLVFVTAWSSIIRLLMTLAIATTASVWLPFNVLGVALLAITLTWLIRARSWLGFVAWGITVVVAWDALISSALYVFGIDVTGGAADADGGDPGSGEAATSMPAQVSAASHLFSAPGGVEQVQPIVAALAVAALVFAVRLVSRHSRVNPWRDLKAFTPSVVLIGYLVLIQVGDAITTGGAPHYGGHKLGFALTIMMLASMLPIALAGLGPEAGRMTAVRWAGVGGVVVLLTLDTILPRAISALSPMQWPSVNPSAPQYWSASEVKPVASQPIDSLPVACMFAPPEAAMPTALPRGQEAYACTRLLAGLTALEGRTGTMSPWLQTDWLSNQSHWEDFYDSLVESTQPIRGRSVILMDSDGRVVGLSPWGLLLDRNRPILSTS